MTLDSQGRCCGRKPIDYKGGSWRSPPEGPHKFCPRCDRSFDRFTGQQIENWAWLCLKPGVFGRRTPTVGVGK